MKHFKMYHKCHLHLLFCLCIVDGQETKRESKKAPRPQEGGGLGHGKVFAVFSDPVKVALDL